MPENGLDDIDYIESAENLESEEWMDEQSQETVTEILESKGVYERYPGQQNLAREMVNYVRENEELAAPYGDITEEFGWSPDKTRNIADELERNGLAEAGDKAVYLSTEFPEKDGPPFQEYSNL